MIGVAGWVVGGGLLATCKRPALTTSDVERERVISIYIAVIKNQRPGDVGGPTRVLYFYVRRNQSDRGPEEKIESTWQFIVG